MAFDIVRGSINNIVATNELIDALNKLNQKQDIDGTLYTGYPLSANAENKVIVDALLISRKYGMVVFLFSDEAGSDKIIDQQGESYFQLTNTLTKYPSLRKGKVLAINPVVITILPDVPDGFTIESEYLVGTSKTIENALASAEQLDQRNYENLTEALQKISTIKPRKKRDNISIEGSKGSIIKSIEKEIANLDKWQKHAAFEIADCPQRIRGLAGSGKTIVLALKAAYLHVQNPNWEIVVTYYTRSLWQQYRDLISKFVLEFSGDDPDWNKIHLFHSWGSLSEQGVYSEIAKSVNFTPVNFANAKAKYGMNNAYSGICDELLHHIPLDYKPQYDVFLIDEAQDMPASFFKLAYKATIKPKRIIWAYDELQNLSSIKMPLIEEMFGLDDDGKPLVQLKNDPNEPQQDIVLPICYRNPPWALALAHSLGLGLYRKPIVQFFDDLSLWEDIGYKVEKGKLKFGSNVTLARRSDAAPKYFTELLSPEDVIVSMKFDNADSQYNWIAKEIERNINNDELDPDDILVIFPNAITAKKDYYEFTKYLNQRNISTNLAGVTNVDRDIFKITGSVSCSSIYRAKGNEAPMVYIVNAEYCFNGYELIKLRNTLFTAITRSRAWVRICGVREKMEGINSEIKHYIDHGYKLTFKIPNESEMAKSRTIHRERTEAESRKLEEASKGLKILIELASKGDLDPSQIPEYDILMQMFMKKKMSELDENDE